MRRNDEHMRRAARGRAAGAYRRERERRANDARHVVSRPSGIRCSQKFEPVVEAWASWRRGMRRRLAARERRIVESVRRAKMNCAPALAVQGWAGFISDGPRARAGKELCLGARKQIGSSRLPTAEGGDEVNREIDITGKLGAWPHRA